MMSIDSSDMKSQQNTRLCHVIKIDNFDGYGFNLHAEKGKAGQYIGKVDEGSPAEVAGLRQGDRILEVNGSSITNETHKQVVQRIKALANETKLLVVDPEEETTSSRSDLDNNSNSSSEKASDTTTASATNNGEQRQPHTIDEENSTTTNNGTLNLSMTAAELRAKLATKKKFDPRKEAVDFKKKFDTVQKL